MAARAEADLVDEFESRLRSMPPTGAEPLSILSNRHRRLCSKFPQYADLTIWVERISGGYLDRSRSVYFVMKDGKRVDLEYDWGGYE